MPSVAVADHDVTAFDARKALERGLAQPEHEARLRVLPPLAVRAAWRDHQGLERAERRNDQAAQQF